jgi:hypothetical protein
MRRCFVLVPGLVVAACSSFGSGAASDARAAPPDAEADALLDATSPDGAPADAPADGAICTTQTFEPFHDASLNFEPNHNDFSGENICNLSVSYCLLSFDIGADAKKSISALALELTRSKSNDCGGAPCDPSRASGKLVVAHMRPDWADAATWYKRTADVGDTWNKSGAEAITDVAMMVAGSAAVLMNDDATTIALDPKTLDPIWLTTSVLAFRVKFATEPFAFVIQRKRSGTGLYLPRLRVTTCQ